MNETLMSRIGKLFFPRLAPDLRHRRMIVISLVTMATLISACVLISWMASTRGIHVTTVRQFPFLQK